jgi:hypothetical protein
MEQKQIFIELKATLDELLQVLSTVDQSKFNVVPFKGSWTAGELSQHLVKSIGGSIELIFGPVKDMDRAPDLLCNGIKCNFLDFSVKFKSSSLIEPEQKHYEKSVQIGALSWLEEKILKAETLDLTKQCTLFEIPVFGPFSRLEALTLVLYHTQRHIIQLRDIIQKVEEKKALAV